MTTATHAIDLAPNRHDDIDERTLTEMFRRATFRLDSYMLGCKHVHLRNSHDRLRIMALPEKLSTNPHLHCFADLSEAQWGDQLRQLPWEWKLEQIWQEVTGGSGTIHITTDFDRGAAVYRTKEALRHEHDYLHSWDFHRDDKLKERRCAPRHQRRAAVRKCRTHQ